MNETLKQIHARKSCRVFTEEPVSETDRIAILQAAVQAPTAGNMSLYSILEIRDPERKQQLAENCDHQDFIAQAPLVLLFVLDYQKWADLFASRQLQAVPDGEADLLLAMSDTLIAAQNAVVAAESLGIHSCYIGDILEHYEENRELFHLPPYVLPVCLLVLGHPASSQIRRQKPPRFALEDMVFTDTYPDRTPSDLEDMLMRKHGCSREEVEGLIRNVVSRKFDADFHQEMNRSVKAMLESWTSGS